MKAVKRIVAVVLVLALCAGGLPISHTEAKSKNIYFSGEYRRKIGPGEYFILKASQYPTPEGKIKGNFYISYYYKPSGSMHEWLKKEMKRVGTNKYTAGKMKLRVYKNKIVITKGGDYNGTYKLKKRYPRP